MADSAEEKVGHEGKAAKKNKKRKGQKPGSTPGGAVDCCAGGHCRHRHQKMLETLNGLLKEAKDSQDHKKASELREQIWVLTDMAAGVKTAIPEADLDKIIEAIESHFRPAAPAANEPAQSRFPPIAVPTVEALIAGLPEDKRLRGLKKKLEQIVGLRERQGRGEKLETNQIEKIKSEESVRKEIEELEEALAAAMAAKS